MTMHNATIHTVNKETHVFKAFFELCQDVPEQHVVLVDLPAAEQIK